MYFNIYSEKANNWINHVTFFHWQAYEMFMKNGNFLILSPIYTVQWGILKVKEWSDARHQQNEYNRRRFDNLIHNMKNASGFIRNSTQVPVRSTTLSQ